MKKKAIIVSILSILAVIAVYHRLTLVRWFQISRWLAMKCPAAAPDCKERFWVHRVNSIAKYREVAPYFTGIECDATYVDSLKNFYVFHPVPNRAADTALPLKDLMEVVDRDSKKIYLDMRGLQVSNMLEASLLLQSITNAEQLKRQALIEIYDPEVAKYFQQHGYHVSVSYGAFCDSFRLDAREPVPDSLKHSLDGILYLSGDIYLLDAMKRNFPGKKYWVWDLSAKNYLDRSVFRKDAADTAVEIILISIRSKNSR